MQDETQRFWQALRTKVDQAATPDPAEEPSMEEAERRMASAGEAPFSDEEIDAIVRSATGGHAAGDRPAEESAPVEEGGAKRGVLLRYRGWTKAAAVVLGLLILYAVGTKEFGDPGAKQRAPFAVAVGDLLDTGEELLRRRSALLEIFVFARTSIRRLKEAEGTGGELREDARAHLDDLLRELRNDQIPAAESLLQRVQEQVGEVPDSRPETRSDLTSHANRARHAIWILKAIPKKDDDGVLNEYRSLLLPRLEREIRS